MPSGKVVEIGTGRSSCRRARIKQIDLSSDLPDVPVLPETLLHIDLGARRGSVNLHEMTRTVLADPGATIQILRQAGRERIFGDERPRRIEDCISALGVQACIDAMARLTVSRAMNKPAIRKVWSHAQEIAENCKLIEEQTAEGTSPNDAYLTGVLHDLGSLPTILDWGPEHTISSDQALVGLRLAEEWFLPQCLVDYFSELKNLKATSRWIKNVQRAHEMAESSHSRGPLSDKREFRVIAFGRP